MTPHNEAKKGDIAKVVLMPGDPLRAKFIAETFLENAVCFNTVRGMLGYTGLYNGKRVSVMGSGMGMPSMGIYSYELYHCYDVEAIIRIGTAGGIADGVELRDLVLAMGACTDSNFAHQYRLPGTFAPTASFELLEKAVQTAPGEELTLSRRQRGDERYFSTATVKMRPPNGKKWAFWPWKWRRRRCI